MPLISICIAVYNLEKYIDDCIKSALNQNFEDYEIVVVDNGSTDNTVAICEGYAKKYSNLRFFALPKPTVFVRAHIYACKQAKGRYIHLIDGDDLLEANYLVNIADIIATKAPELIMGNFTCKIEEGGRNYLDVDIDAEQINNKPTKQAIEYIYSLPYINLYVWRFIANRRLFDLVDFNGDIARLIPIDSTKTNMWLLNTKSIYFVKEPFYIYRQRVGSTVASANNPLIIDLIKVSYRFAQMLLENNADKWKLNLAKNQNNWYVRMFIQGLPELNEAQLQEIEHFLEANKEINLPKDWDLHTFNGYIQKYGAKKGLHNYYDDLTASIKSLFTEKTKEYYIMPAGKSGAFALRLLEKWGYSIKGFIDNDPLKENTLFCGYKCALPKNLKHTDAMVVVSSMYDKMAIFFKEMLNRQGLNSNNIITIPFSLLKQKGGNYE